MVIVIGSIAANYHLPKKFQRETRDIDVVGTYDEIVQFAKSYNRPFKACYPINEGKTLIIKIGDDVIVEGSITWEGSLAADFAHHVGIDSDTRQIGGWLVPSLNVLYMLKMSHRYLRNAPSFKKTMRDIHIMRTQFVTIPEMWQEHYQRRMKEQYSYAHPKLNVSKGDFFNGDGVDYKYDHDTIHEAVKHLEKPAYAYFKPADSQVMVSKEMWDKLKRETQLLSVLEEAYVLALERSQIPFPHMTPRASFDIALEKVCTSITSGWWREFAWENHKSVELMYDDSYVDRFWAGVESGIVKPYDSTKGLY